MYRTILVPTDGSDGAVAAATHALDIARTYGATVHALHVVDVRMSPIDTDMDRDEVVRLLEQSGEKPTAPIRELGERAGVPTVESVRLGVPAEIIRGYVDDHDVDLVVMGTRGRTGLEHVLLGSVTERTLRTVDAPVLAVPRDPE
jgi:nucleotide-binding universal stress UspA family protein